MEGLHFAELTLEAATEPPAPAVETPIEGETEKQRRWTDLEIGTNGERYRVHSFTYEMDGREHTSSRREPVLDTPDPFELAYAAIVRDDGKACADIVVELARDLGCGIHRARELAQLTSDEYRNALRAHVEAWRARRKASREQSAHADEQSTLVAAVRAADHRVRTTNQALDTLLDRRKRARAMKAKGGEAADAREEAQLRERLAKQTQALEDARAKLAAHRGAP